MGGAAGRTSWLAPPRAAPGSPLGGRRALRPRARARCGLATLGRRCFSDQRLVIHDELRAVDLLVEEPTAIAVDLVDVTDVDVNVLNRMPQFGGDPIALALPGDVLVLEATDRDGFGRAHDGSALRARAHHPASWDPWLASSRSISKSQPSPSGSELTK